jgi:hypothetical protein
MNSQPTCPPEVLAGFVAAFAAANSAADEFAVELLKLADLLEEDAHPGAGAVRELARAPYVLPRLHPTAHRAMACGSWWRIDYRVCQWLAGGPFGVVRAVMYPEALEARRVRRAISFNPAETAGFGPGPDPRSTRRAFERVRLRLAAALFGLCVCDLAVRDFLSRDAGGATLARLLPGLSRADVEAALADSSARWTARCSASRSARRGKRKASSSRSARSPRSWRSSTSW